MLREMKVKAGIEIETKVEMKERMMMKDVMSQMRELKFVMRQIEKYTHKIALALATKGLINIQFAIKNDKVYIIEANPRASRTVPFICKAYEEPYVNFATQIMLGHRKLKDFNFKPNKHGYAIKEPAFSFEKFPNVNKELGPEMKSTGESIYFIDDLMDDYFLKVYSERNLYLSK